MSNSLKKAFSEYKTDKKTIAKTITKLVVRRSVSGVMVTLVHNYVPTETKAQQAQLYIGAWALGGVVSDSAANWAANTVGDLIEIVEKVWDPESSDESNTTETTK